MLLLITLTALTAIAGFLIANGSLAWFADNYEVSANGLSAKAQVSPNLVIVKSEEDFANGNLGFSVDMNSTDNANMIAITRDENPPYDYVFPNNLHAIDSVTGNAKPGAELYFDTVPSDGDGTYFIDYTVYIASTEKPLAVDSLKAAVTIPESVDLLHNYFMAASVDFYVDSVSEENYRGTASVADAQSGDESTGVDIFATVSGTVPFYKDGSIKIIMRCYFDGALQDSEGNAYINSYTVRTDGVVIGVTFTAEEAEG